MLCVCACSETSCFYLLATVINKYKHALKMMIVRNTLVLTNKKRAISFQKVSLQKVKIPGNNKSVATGNNQGKKSKNVLLLHKAIICFQYGSISD